MKRPLFLFLLLLASRAWADIPATPVMTLYQFNGSLEVPYYDIDDFQRSGATASAGSLSQGTSLIPCLVIRNGEPLTDSRGTPYVGFEIVVDARTATPSSTEQFRQAVNQRKTLTVDNHHCDGSVRHVIDARRLYALEKAPFFDPPASRGADHQTRNKRGALRQGTRRGSRSGPLKVVDLVVRHIERAVELIQRHHGRCGNVRPCA